MKYLVLIGVAGLAFWGIEKYGMKDGRLFGQFEFPDAKDGDPKLSAGYFIAGTAIVGGALLAGWAVHKISGGRLPRGAAVAGK